MSQPATNMAADLDLEAPQFAKKYGVFQKSAVQAFEWRRPLRATDRVFSRLENLVLREDLSREVRDPIFVTGNFRSGTTLLERIITFHKSLGYFTYLTSVLPRSPFFASFINRAVPSFHSKMIPPHQPNMVIESTWPYEAEIIWRFCKNNPWTAAPSNVLDATFSDPSFEKIFPQLINKHLLHQGVSRFINKNPPNTVRLGYLAKIFPSAKFVHIVRNPLRMLRSQLDLQRIAQHVFAPLADKDCGEAFSEFFAPGAPLCVRTPRYSAIANVLKDDTRLGLAMSIIDVENVFETAVRESKLADRVIIVRYEDLLETFAATMRDILDFLSLDDADAIVKQGAAFLHRDLISQHTPLPEFGAKVRTVLQPMMERYGYK